MHILNRLLPMSLRKVLRRAALATIPSMRHLDMPRRMKHLRKIGFIPKTIVDVGAAQGHWARLAASIWPEAKIYGFEPNISNEPMLRQTKQELKQFDYVLGFLGPQPGEVVYSDQKDQTSLLDDSSNRAGTHRARVYTLDDWASEAGIQTIDFLKLDVQGYELEVLKGASRVLQTCPAVLMEVSMIEFFPKLPLVDEIIVFMRDRGFVWYDVMGILRRASDDALLQMDLMFVRRDHPLRQSKSA
jgi:FkbM family methyltransferase